MLPNKHFYFFLLLLALSALFSCKRDMLYVSSDDNFFSYNGSDGDVRTLIANLKNLDDSIHFSSNWESVPMWDKSNRLMSLSGPEKSGFTVPITKDGKLVSGFLEIESIKPKEMPRVYDGVDLLSSDDALKIQICIKVLDIYRVKKIQIDEQLSDKLKKRLLQVPGSDIFNSASNTFGYIEKNVKSIDNESKKSSTSTSPDYCSLIITSDFMGFFTNGCSENDVKIELNQAVSLYLDQRLSHVHQITQIGFVPNIGWVITGESAYLIYQEANLRSLVDQAPHYITGHCFGGPWAFVNVRTYNGCISNSGGNDGPGTNPSPDTPPIEIIKDSIRSKVPCVSKLVLDRLESIPQYNQMVQPFLQIGLRPSITWNATDQSWGANNSYSGGTTGISSNSGLSMSSDINLNKNMIQRASKLLVAAVAIHETYHAYINYMFATKTNVNLIDQSKPNYMAGLYQYIIYNQVGSGSNYVDHYNMLTSQYNNMVAILQTYMTGNSSYNYTLDDYRKAMLFGMDNPGPNADQYQTQFIHDAYNDLLLTYGFTSADMQTFNRDHVNSAPQHRVPTTGCN